MFMSMDKRSYASIRLFIKDLSGNVRHKRAEEEQLFFQFSCKHSLIKKKENIQVSDAEK